jgi:hypothetical protein
MTPTAKLRFVERTVQVPFQNYKNVTESKTVRILQQWWMPIRTFSDGYGYQTVELVGGEWRDVPLEEEQA